MLFDPKNYPNLFVRGKSVNLGFTTNIRKNHAYIQRRKRLILYRSVWSKVNSDFWKLSGKRQGSASDSNNSNSSHQLERFPFYVKKLVRIFLMEQYKFLVTK